MRRLVISMGGGAVIRPVNWKYMQKSVSIFIDVPLDALAKRLTAIGTASRPLLHHGSGDAYTQTFKRLCKLWEERSEAYSNAQVTVSLERIASKLGHEDVCSVNPTQIAIEVIDSTHYEEAVMGGSMTATLNTNGDVCAIQKAGGAGVLQSSII